MSTDVGQGLVKATAVDASALLEASPTALLFGAWHSTGDGGELSAKFARCFISEIVVTGAPVERIVDRRTGEVDQQ
jgi:CRISPR-associated protein Csb1